MEFRRRVSAVHYALRGLSVVQMENADPLLFSKKIKLFLAALTNTTYQRPRRETEGHPDKKMS